MISKSNKLGPLQDSQTVIIIGGGPAGSSCAISLKTLGRRLGKDINVVLYEGRRFDPDCIKRVGVLAPPLVQTLEETLGVPFPCQAIERKIVGYYLHSGDAKIRLHMGGNLSYVTHNIAIDTYLLEKAREMGVTVLPGRVEAIDFYSNKVVVKSDAGGTEGDVLVGAFGLDATTAASLEKVTPYRRPKPLYSILTKIPASKDYLQGCEDYVHVFLPSMEDIEFGVVTPKLTNFVVNVAGPEVNKGSLKRFLSLPEIRELVHSRDPGLVSQPVAFPLEPARNCFGDRWVAIGDTAGLVRAYKGNGINAACTTGAKAAEVMLKVGISKEAFKSYHNAFSDIVNDLHYGRVLRKIILYGERTHLMPEILRVASRDRKMVNVLIDFLSGNKTYRRILKESGAVNLLIRFLKGLTPSLLQNTRLARKATKGLP